jgi:hypothetical protein
MAHNGAKMRSIRVSDEVWDAIAARGRFGETEDDVLRRVLGVEAPPTVTTKAPDPGGAPGSPRPRLGYAADRMSTDVRNNQLRVSFESGPRESFSLPKKTDLDGIRRIRSEAVQWARSNGASPGQEDAVKKALTTAGYYVRGTRS